VGRRGTGASYGGRGGVCWLKEKLYMELAGVGQKKSPFLGGSVVLEFG